MEYLDALKWRFATKEFNDKQVSQEDLNDLLQAAILAPGSYNIQPWKIVVTTDEDTLKELAPASYNQPQVTTTKTLLTFCANKDLEDSFEQVIDTLKEGGATDEDLAGYVGAVNDLIGSMDSEEQHHFADRQMYIALGNLLSAAALKKIDAGPMEGLDAQAVSDVLGLPENLVPRAQVAIGYRAADPQQPKVRNPQEKMVEYRK